MHAVSWSVRLLLRDRTPRHAAGEAEGAAALALPGLIFALLAGRWVMGLPALCHVPYWYLSYTEGFIRRAFVGTFTTPLLVGRPLSQVLAMIAVFGGAATLVLLAALTFGAVRRGGFDALSLAFLFSNALPWLARDLGTLDPFFVLASFGAFLLIERGYAAIGLALCVIAPLIHEGALFLLLPLLGGLFVLRRDCRLAAFAGGTAAGLAALALWLFSTTNFAWPAGMPTGVADNFVQWELGQGFHYFAPRMTAGIVVFSVLPCLAMAAVAARRAGLLIGIGVLAGVLFTWSVALIAIDTARIFAWGPFTALGLAALAQRSFYAGRGAPAAD